MKAQRCGEADARPVPATRFGIRLGGVAVAMPAGTPLEFVADAAIYPLPLAPARVTGLMQLRGQPLLVLDAATPPAARGLRRHDVLVIGQPPQAAALLVDEPPQPLADVPRGAARPLPAGCVFASALSVDDAGGDGDACTDECRYELDPARLFDALVRS
ncbi:MAG: hypothetical protein KJ011_19170 [Burkholderiaceae bacterium]|nr:hypothetical protein [Burkholderiaceae bacterium]